MAAPSVVALRRPARVLIVGSTMGAGHMTAARVLAEHVAERGGEARVVDYLALPSGPHGRFARGIYRLMVTRAPWLYDELMRTWMMHPAAFERLSAVGENAYARGLAGEVAAFAPDVVIATYNLAGQLLGRLRERGRLGVPVVVYVTDAGAHPYWCAAGADLHLAPLALTAARLRELGAEPVEVVDPLVAPPAGMSRDQARATLGLGDRDTIALVNGGSWGVGAVADAARCIASAGATAYVLTGTSTGLARAVAGVARCHAIGWTDAVREWIAAADVVVDSAGGTTCWEAIVAGTPVIVHRPLAGHGRLNAAALHDAGLVTVTWSDAQLAHAVRHVGTSRHDELVHGTDAADMVLAAA